MQDQQRFIMVSPAPGFTNRVMARLAERERARARRRAMIGSALLVGAAIAMLALAAWQFAAAWVLITNPQTLIALWNAFQTLTFWLGVLLNAFWITANVVAANLDPLQTLTCALAVFALTMLWARAVTGSFQLSLNYTRGWGK